MLVKKIIKIPRTVFSIENEELSETISLGVYFENGVLRETDAACGIGDLTDCILFNMLSDQEFSDSTEITGYTYYPYSEYVLTCKSELAKHEFEKMMDIIISQPIREEDMRQTKLNLEKRVQEISGNIDKSFDARYYECKRLGQEVVGMEESVHSISVQNIKQYRRQYYSFDQAVVCVTGGEQLSNAFTQESGECRFTPPTIMSHFYGKRSDKDDFIMETDWDDSDVVIAFDCPMIKQQDMLLWELLCCAAERQLKKYFDSDLHVMEKPLIEPYYSSYRMIFKFSVDNAHLKERLSLIFSVFQSALNDGLASESENAKAELQANYEDLLENNVSLNQFFGWNYFVGSLYAFNDLVNIQGSLQQIEYRQLALLCRQIFCNRNVVIGLTNNSKICPTSELAGFIENLRVTL